MSDFGEDKSGPSVGTPTSPESLSLSGSLGPGKVRAMFEARRVEGASGGANRNSKTVKESALSGSWSSSHSSKPATTDSKHSSESAPADHRIRAERSGGDSRRRLRASGRRSVSTNNLSVVSSPSSKSNSITQRNRQDRARHLPSSRRSRSTEPARAMANKDAPPRRPPVSNNRQPAAASSRRGPPYEKVGSRGSPSHSDNIVHSRRARQTVAGHNDWTTGEDGSTRNGAVQHKKQAQAGARDKGSVRDSRLPHTNAKKPLKIERENIKHRHQSKKQAVTASQASVRATTRGGGGEAASRARPAGLGARKVDPHMSATSVSALSFLTPSTSGRNDRIVDTMSVVSAPADPSLVQCSYCSRSFAQDRIGKHEEVCDKGNSKKRRPFDPIKMRVKGTESEKFIRKIKDNKNAPSPLTKQDWRREHQEFVETIRSAKVAQEHVAAGGRLQDLAPPPVSDTSHYVPCPHCGRKFSAAAAERHIAKCATIASNKPATVRSHRRR